VVVSDVNNDGRLDIAVSENYPYGLGVFVGNNLGDFAVQTIVSTKNYSFENSLAVGDLNDDGCPDMVALKDSLSALYILLNTCACYVAIYHQNGKKLRDEYTSNTSILESL
jgi:hypothetical protein